MPHEGGCGQAAKLDAEDSGEAVVAISSAYEYEYQRGPRPLRSTVLVLYGWGPNPPPPSSSHGQDLGWAGPGRTAACWTLMVDRVAPDGSNVRYRTIGPEIYIGLLLSRTVRQPRTRRRARR